MNKEEINFQEKFNFEKMSIDEYIEWLNRKLPRDDWKEIFKEVVRAHSDVDTRYLELTIQEFLRLIYPWCREDLKPLNRKRSIISLLKKLVFIFKDPIREYLYLRGNAILKDKDDLKSTLKLREEAGPSLAYALDELWRMRRDDW